MRKVGGAGNGDTPAPADNNPPADDNNPPADDNNPDQADAGGPNRLVKLGEDAKDTAAGVAGAGLVVVSNVAKVGEGVTSFAAGVTGALGNRALTSAQKQQTKLKTARAISDSKTAAAVAESEKQAYTAAIKAENKAQEHREKTLKNEMANFKSARKQSEQQQTIKDRQWREALSVVNASKVEFVGKDEMTLTTPFKKLEAQQVGDTKMFFAVPKTMDDLNGELLEKFGRNFVNGGFELDRTDKNSLFRSLEHNFPVPPVEYLKGWIKWIRGENPVLREKKDESDEVVAAQPEVSHSHLGVIPHAIEGSNQRVAAVGGSGKTKRKKRTSKRKNKTSKRKKKTSKRKKKTSKRKKRTLKKRY